MLPSSLNAVSDSEDITETRPMSCAHVGLDCATCVRQSARHVASLCSHLSEDRQTGVFFQLYRDQVCRTNVKRFRREYEQLTALIAPPDLSTPDTLELAIA
jgi:recombinational DNA repair protein RecR